MFRIKLAGLMGIMLLTTGCATTRVTFDGPPGSVMTVDNKPYHLPAQVELQRPGGVGQSTRYDVSLVFTSHDAREVRAKGHLDMLGYNESDVDRLAVNTCNLDESQLVKILDGTVVIFKGQSATRQPLYELTLGKQ
ncbi:MAG TPA: hypothetical protein VH475_11515 [Tepidisphaeraceae bacterium]|jgi:hypothetical protein